MLSENKLIARVAWTVDGENSCLGAGLDYEISDDDLDTIEKLGNSPVISRLLSCKQDFEFKGKKRFPVEKVCDRFKRKVMPFLAEDKIAGAVVAILYLISKDETTWTERRECFKKYLGMYGYELQQQTKFDAPDFFARILLYTTSFNNREGQPYADMITEEFFEEAANATWAELKWNTDTQTLELLPSEEERLLEEVNSLSDLRLSVMYDQDSFIDTGWLGVDREVLFPSRYHHFEIKNPEIRKLLSHKMQRYIQLVRKFMDCLVSSESLVAQWPVFPDERTLAIRQQLAALSKEMEDIYWDTFAKTITSGRKQKDL